MSEKSSFKIYREPQLQSSSMVVGWNEDAGRLGTKVVDYLIKKLDGQECGEIEPADFFPLSGVSVEDDVARFPESKFYYCPKKNLVILKSNPPRSEWYKFLNLVLDIAEQYWHVKELCTIGGMITLSPHTTPRELLAIPNSLEMKKVLSQHELARDTDYETPPGQRPTLSSYLLWVAKQRNIIGASLWVPVPFYLVAMEDPQAWRKVLDFLDKNFSLGLDFKDLDEEIGRQDEKIAQVRMLFPEIDRYIQKLENSLGLTERENEKLVREIEEYLRKRD